jgi:hypothetical protein
MDKIKRRSGVEAVTVFPIIGKKREKSSNHRNFFFMRMMCCAAVAAYSLTGFPCMANPLLTQTVPLEAGWNAVYLEVMPTNSSANALLAGTLIDTVASHFSAPSFSQFATSPNANMLSEVGWGIWYAPDRPDAFLGTLQRIQGKRAYLVHAAEAFAWRVNGTVEPPQISWVPDAYNFVGFGVDEQAAPTFAQFFAGSAAHTNLQIYRLVHGEWRKVTNPSSAVMRAGEAFWVYCSGSSDYQGPLRAEAGAITGLKVGGRVTDLVLRNESDHPVTPTIRHVALDTPPVPLSVVVQVVGDPDDPVREGLAGLNAGDVQAMPLLEAGASIRVPLLARLSEMTELYHYSLLVITTDMGTIIRIPVYAIREDLP